MGKLLKRAQGKMKKLSPKVEILLKKKRRKPQRPRHDRVAAAVVAVEQNRL